MTIWPHSSPLISVVIPFYNCSFVDQAIASVWNQQYPHVEIIVVDDGSTLHLDRLREFGTRIRYLPKPNGGTASALNAGIRAAKGEYITWLSSDDVMLPGKIERQTAYMQAHQALISWTDFHLIGAAGEMLIPHLAAKFPSAPQFIASMLRFCPVNGSTVMMHRSLPHHVGWFDESLSCTQDYDYWLRVHLHRIDFHFMDEALTLYRWHEAMGTQQKKDLADYEFGLVRDRYAPAVHALLSVL